MKRTFARIVAPLIVVAAGVGTTFADSIDATHYYLALGDSLAASDQPNGVSDQGYAEQLYARLVAQDPKLELKKMGCGGESTVSMRFGSQDPSVVLSCASPAGYRQLYPKGTQLAEAVSFLQAHKGKVALVTIDLGANDVYRIDAQGNIVSCLFDPAGCAFENARAAENLAAILAQLRAAAGPEVRIVGMTYYPVYAPLCNSDSSLMFICGNSESLNAALVSAYNASSVPAADVAGAFFAGEYPDSAVAVCNWTWFCSVGDVHPNVGGYAVIADEFWKIVQP
jgi:lysophospholipase L1-like esterase